MKKSFADVNVNEAAKAEQAAAETTEVTTSALVPTPTPEETSLVTDDFWDNEESIDPSMIKTPRLELTHGVGFGPEVGIPPGHLVYNREAILAKPTSPSEISKADAIAVFPLRFFTEYEEVVSKDEYEARKQAGERVPRFRTEAEARKAGLISQKEKKANPSREEPVYHPILHLKVLIQGNKEGLDAMPLEFEGKKYAVAEIILKKGAYWTIGGTILTHANSCKQFTKKPIWSRGFLLGAVYSSFRGSKKSWNLTDAGRANTTDAFIKWAEQYA